MEFFGSIHSRKKLHNTFEKTKAPTVSEANYGLRIKNMNKKSSRSMKDAKNRKSAQISSETALTPFFSGLKMSFCFGKVNKGFYVKGNHESCQLTKQKVEKQVGWKRK